jgi:cytochrome d ubiquinol oxidase subunit I
MFTRKGVSPLVGPGLVVTSLVVLSLLYLALAVVEVGLIMRYVKAGPPDTEEDARTPIEPPERDAGRSDDEAERPLSFAY